ncbi:hypothetical protein [Gloeothece verrucosa]|uniref:PEP-CTERM sorting domain-containing protein n=1 Tax=Gloeothece verrucosa (strain PCC 7822) TaxID=497965 RepID=E0ULS2_GLOV7|nr:hypothetical protein [Gloeothece verrucosa]ADN17902.1 hypothetical protein Cyan7822_6056 [Gloeothece verrucosa PCC 7822]
MKNNNVKLEIESLASISNEKKIISSLKECINISFFLIVGILGLDNRVLGAELNLLSGWEIAGDVQIESATRVNLSSDGLFDDDIDLAVQTGEFNFSGNAASVVGFGSLETFLGIDVAQLNLEGVAYEGSAIKTNLSVNTRSELSFDWEFLTNETFELPLRPFNDYGFVQIGQQVNKLTDYQNTQKSPNCSFGFVGCTGVKSLKYTLAAGQYTLAFGVIDVDDFAITSALKVSKINLTPNQEEPVTVPEPNLVFAIFTALSLATSLSPKKSNNKN